jgi:hypothetical protein
MHNDVHISQASGQAQNVASRGELFRWLKLSKRLCNRLLSA